MTAATETNLHVQRGFEAQARGDHDGARVHFWRAVHVLPAVPGALFQLGHCYLKGSGDRIDNARQAMACFREGLETFPVEVYPVDHALFRASIGDACLRAAADEGGDAVEAAIDHHEAALAILRQADEQESCAHVLDKLGNDYCEREHGERCRNLERAAEYFTEAVAANRDTGGGRQWATSVMNLGTVYRELAACSGPECLERALSCYAAALQVRTPESDPEGHAALENNIANVHMTSPFCEEPERCRKAIGLYRDSLRVRTKSAHPADFAVTCFNLGQAYMQTTDEHGSGHLRRAAVCFRGAVEAAATAKLDRIHKLALQALRGACDRLAEPGEISSTRTA